MIQQPAGNLIVEEHDLDEPSLPPEDADTGITLITKQEAEELLDRQARKYLGLSGPEFRRQYQAGTIADPDRSAVIRVYILLRLADE